MNNSYLGCRGIDPEEEDVQPIKENLRKRESGENEDTKHVEVKFTNSAESEPLQEIKEGQSRRP